MLKDADQAFRNSNQVRITGRRVRHVRLQPNVWLAIDPVPGHYFEPRSVRHFLEKFPTIRHSNGSLSVLPLADAASDLIQSP